MGTNGGLARAQAQCQTLTFRQTVSTDYETIKPQNVIFVIVYVMNCFGLHRIHENLHNVHRLILQFKQVALQESKADSEHLQINSIFFA